MVPGSWAPKLYSCQMVWPQIPQILSSIDFCPRTQTYIFAWFMTIGFRPWLLSKTRLQQSKHGSEDISIYWSELLSQDCTCSGMGGVDSITQEIRRLSFFRLDPGLACQKTQWVLFTSGLPPLRLKMRCLSSTSSSEILAPCDLNSERTLGAFDNKGTGTFHVTRPVTYTAILWAGTVMLFHFEMKQVRLSEATSCLSVTQLERGRGRMCGQATCSRSQILRSYESQGFL